MPGEVGDTTPPLQDAELVAPKLNWGKLLDQVALDYATEPARGLVHGLQKEAIQNSWGARNSRSTTPWLCSFRLIDSPRGLLLTITDQGTFGLTGSPTPPSGDAPSNPKERLGRFESYFESGGNEGPGLFGRGKFIFNACSRSRLIFYDSLTADGDYRFGLRKFEGRKCEQLPLVRQGSAAEESLRAELAGSLSPLATPGTRITIVDPIEEVVQAIDGTEFLANIGETWWEIIQKQNARISVQGRKGPLALAVIPPSYGGFPLESKGGWQVFHRQNQVIDVAGTPYKVKHLHILLPPPSHKMGEGQIGIFVHRRGMQVGPLRIPTIAPEVEDRLFGYVQLDAPYEDAISHCEGTTHYGFAHAKNPEVRFLKKWVQDNCAEFLASIGFRPKNDDNSRARVAAAEVQEELNSILHELGVPSISMGPDRKREFSLAIEGLSFPGGTNEIKFGQSVSGFRVAVRNRTAEARTAYLDVFTRAPNNSRIEVLLDRVKFDLTPGHQEKSTPLEFWVQSPAYPSGRVDCIASLRAEDGGVLASRSFHIYVDTPAPPRPPEYADIELLGAVFPRDPSHRVDYGQSILELKYSVHNRSARRMFVRLATRTVWDKEGVELEVPYKNDVELGPFGSFDFDIPELKVSEEIYQEVDSGRIKIRTTATATEGTVDWAKGTRLAEHTTSFYLNTEPGSGFFEWPPVYTKLGPDGVRSKAVPTMGTRSYQLALNTDQTAYIEAIKDSDRIRNYIFEESARQIPYVLLHRGQLDTMLKILGKGSRGGAGEWDPEDIVSEVVYPFVDRIIAKHYR